MDELIQQLVGKTGIDASLANNATGKVMAMMKEQAGDDLFGKISAAIPGAGQLAEQGATESAGAGAGGMLGKLADVASSAFGGSAGGGLELGAILGAAGLDTSQIATFISTLVQFLKDKLGDDVLAQLLEKLPMLKNLPA